MLHVSPTIVIPDGELEERFLRASGPGGQHVNRTESAVELRFDVAGSPSLPEPLRARLLARRDRRLTVDGVMVIQAQRFRSQEQNREDARARLKGFIEASLKVPRKRVPTRPTRASKERRIEGKKRRADIKQGRGRLRGEDS
ncbi:MAG TPA: alternative ribosome rescue aminoacyl-tRNA hydrolase ArfB [Chiayiivirga sp.]|nr:alternative ribosome rescue aminoacyl-tRNA hydrolase ArfB [Chiayiivirga sp.]